MANKPPFNMRFDAMQSSLVLPNNKIGLSSTTKFREDQQSNLEMFNNNEVQLVQHSPTVVMENSSDAVVNVHGDDRRCPTFSDVEIRSDLDLVPRQDHEVPVVQRGGLGHQPACQTRGFSQRTHEGAPSSVTQVDAPASGAAATCNGTHLLLTLTSRSPGEKRPGGGSSRVSEPEAMKPLSRMTCRACKSSQAKLGAGKPRRPYKRQLPSAAKQQSKGMAVSRFGSLWTLAS